MVPHDDSQVPTINAEILNLVVGKLCLEDWFKEVVAFPDSGEFELVADEFLGSGSPDVELVGGAQSCEVVFPALQGNELGLTPEILELQGPGLENRFFVDLVHVLFDPPFVYSAFFGQG